jgi:uncharacterized protein YbjQ (UPF0145 family)
VEFEVPGSVEVWNRSFSSLPVQLADDRTEAERDFAGEQPSSLSGPFVTTLPFLPGFRTVRSLGVVSELGAASGFTATMKGEDAVAKATSAMRSQALNMGANAILGLSASTFAAGGGITNVFGGDAVGVLFLGTAVVVERDTIALVTATEVQL